MLVIEKDPDLVERLRDALDVTWVAADACEVTLARRGRAWPSVDVVVAATGDDEDNLVISLLAKQEFAVPRVVARVNHPKNQWLFNESLGRRRLGVDPALLTALVEEAVSVGSLVRLLQFEGGHGPPGRGHPGRGLAGRRDGHRRPRHPPRRHRRGGGPRATGSSSPGATPSSQPGDEVLVLVTGDAEDAVRSCSSATEPAGRRLERPSPATGWRPRASPDADPPDS